MHRFFIAGIALCLTLTLQPGHVMRVIDGDTFVLWSLTVPPEERVRLLGVDTPELNQDKGPEAKVFTEAWLSRGPFRFMACKKDSFGRWLATLSREGANIADELRARGLVK